MSSYNTLQEIQRLTAEVETSNNIHKEVYGAKDSNSSKVVDEKQIAVADDKVADNVDIDKVNSEKPKQQSIQEPSQAQDDTVDFKHKYKTLQGKYEAEISRMREAIAQKNTELVELKDIVIGLQRDATVKNNETTQAHDTQANNISIDKLNFESSKYIKPEDSDVFGSEQIDFVTRVASEIVESKLATIIPSINNTIDNMIAAINDKISNIDNKFNPISERVDAVQSNLNQTIEDTFEDKLSKLVPNWTEVNIDPLFISWLNEQYDPNISTFTRYDLLKDAHKKRDVKRVANIFKAYIESLKVIIEPEPTVVANRKTSELEKQVVPNRVSTNSNDNIVKNAPDNVETHSYSEYTQITKDLSAGNITLKQADDMRKVLDKALVEGRLIK